jgi:hypothetical protein
METLKLYKILGAANIVAFRQQKCGMDPMYLCAR